MNPNDPRKGIAPDIPVSPEDDPELQAIEALEVRIDDVYPKPKPITPVKVDTPVVIAPPPVVEIVEPEPAPELAPIAIATPEPEPTPAITPPPVVPETPKTIAAKMDEEIANVPASRSPFQFFIHQQIPKKSLVIIFVIIGLILVGVGVFVVLQSTH